MCTEEKLINYLDNLCKFVDLLLQTKKGNWRKALNLFSYAWFNHSKWINKDQKGKRMHRTFHEKFRAEKLEKIL